MKIHVASMLMSTLALTLFAGSVTAVHAAPMPRVHMHPEVVDTRVEFHVFNHSLTFREIVVDGKTYEVGANRGIAIKAPAGTVVYAGCNVPLHKKGSVLMEVTDEMKGKTVQIG